MALDAQCGDFPRVIVLTTPSNTSFERDAPTSAFVYPLGNVGRVPQLHRWALNEISATID